ncbi:MAG TPA: immunoglobulin domain-containing protein, partial [Steroidobacteraceae bacterium]
SYATPATIPSDSGAAFSVVVSNSAGKITSRAAKLTVSAVAPAITRQPADATVTAGSSATFSLVATGTAPLGYQWQKAGTPIAGATAATYTTPPTTHSESGTGFAVVVTNSAGSITSRTAVLTVSSTAPSIAAQPADQSVHSGQTATFSVTAAGSAPLSYQWRKNGTAISGATATSYITAATSSADNGTLYSVTVSNAAGSATSRNAQLTVSAAVTGGADVVTYKNDLARTGQNLNEKTLTPANVSSSGFGKLRFLSTDGKVDAQPLYLSALHVGGAAHNVVFVATENDSVYAFDADNGAVLWKVSLVPAGETVNDLPPQSCDQVSPTIGITSTPVIDRSAGAHGTIYLVAMSKSTTSATWHHRLHALDVTTGAELPGGPKEITASYAAASGTITFDPAQYEERAALLLSKHTIYTSWTSHCDHQFYTGWIMAYSQATLQQTATLNVAPNSGGQGPAIWMAGGGPAADSAGNVYLLTANGVFEETLDANGFPNQHDYANSFLRLSTAGGALTVADYFALSNTTYESSHDMDLGSGGIMLLPDLSDAGGTTRHLAVGAGKDGNIYVVERDSMGHFSKSGNNIWQQLTQVLGNSLSGGGLGGVWATPAYFNGHVYYGSTGGHVTSFAISGAKLSAAPTASSIPSFYYPGTSPVISANGSSDGILWAHQNTNPAVLFAFDATNIAHELYDSSQAGSRDQFGAGNKFITPMVADGKVFVGTTNGVAVFGLLN